MTDAPNQAGARGITVVLVEDFAHLALSCAIEPLRLANYLSGKPLYRWRLASVDGAPVACSNGARTMVDQGLVPLERNETLFVLSGLHMERGVPQALIHYLRRERARGTRIGALCSGAWVLAAAGILDGQPAAIHWFYHDAFREAFPNVELRRTVFVRDGRSPTASGGTATADLMLAMIADHHGADLAVQVADQMVYSGVRDGSGEQRISIQSRSGLRNPHVTAAVQLMRDRIEEPITTSEIAGQVGISTRQLERLFLQHFNCSPKRFATDLRLEKARKLLLQTEFSATEIAHACGFASTTHFARVYRRRFGVTPTQQRAFPDGLGLRSISPA